MRARFITTVVALSALNLTACLAQIADDLPDGETSEGGDASAIGDGSSADGTDAYAEADAAEQDGARADAMMHVDGATHADATAHDAMLTADASVPSAPSPPPPWHATPGHTPACNPSNGTGGTMCPGADCRSCHSWTVCGTVFSHATDAVASGVSGATVHVHDAHGHSFSLTTNRVGNFYTSQAVAFPIHVEVHDGSVVRTMPIAASRGGCNGCHTLPSRSGTSGRIYAR